jgi:hypothetical protein
MNAKEFEQRFGFAPQQDDLERVNCPLTEIGHQQCGICEKHNRPMFMCSFSCRKPRYIVVGVCQAGWHSRSEQIWTRLDGGGYSGESVSTSSLTKEEALQKIGVGTLCYDASGISEEAVVRFVCGEPLHTVFGLVRGTEDAEYVRRLLAYFTEFSSKHDGLKFGIAEKKGKLPWER